ncbi:MAG: AMP-binding protein [Sneathiella sp.]|nr:AMP-binding protein [Sneathiella sp.]
MYKFQLSESLVPAQDDDVVLETTVGGLLRDMAGQRPDATALVEIDMDGEVGRKWTFSELLQESEKLAHALASRFETGERITVWAPNIPEWVLMEYACAFAGLVLVTANPSYQAAELRYVLEQSGSVALFSVSSYRGNPMAEIAQTATEGLNAIRETVNLEDKTALFRVDGGAPVLPTVAAGDAAQIQYTSGTTGFPKGAVLTHRGLTNNARFFARRTNSGPESVWANFMPMFHTSGCGMITLGSVQAGCKMLIVKLFEPGTVLRMIEREKVTALLGVPTMLVALLEMLQHEKRDISSLEIAISGGSMVAPELVRNVLEKFGCSFATVYGQTEASPLVTQHYPDDTVDDICNTIGQPMPQTSVSIRSIGGNKVLPIDTVGEICVKGYCNMIGYNANETATADAIDAEGWLHTGDLGAMDSRGYCRITGRVKEMIIRGGENMFPAEIENVLLGHPLVVEVAVVGLPDDKWGEIIACFVRPEPNHEIDPQDLRAFCRQHLSPQKTPVVWRTVRSFPLTGSGKIQKFALRDAYLAGDYG